MKATKYIAALALMMGLAACQPAEVFNGKGSVQDADSVAVVFNVLFPEPIPVATKGTMGEGPLASEAFDLHLCVYGSGDGYVQNWITAIPIPNSQTTRIIDGEVYITGGQFKTFLPITDEKRTIHFIANPPAEVVPTTNDYLDNVMENMVNTKNASGAYECSYWQEIILEHGIHPKLNAEPDQDSGLPFISDDSEFSDIHLLRNFAKIIVEGPFGAPGDDEAIEVVQWTLINVPKKGYVAPYQGSDASSRFPSGYLNDYLQTVDVSTSEGVDAWWKQLTGDATGQDNYPGSLPNDEEIIDDTFPGEAGNEADGVIYVAGGAAKYMYERPKPNTRQVQTAVLVQIRFKPDHGKYLPSHPTNSYWYKIELLDDKGAYFPILRDFVFTLHIKGLEEYGEATAAEAFAGPYYGNISASLETASLSELSNGESLIHVDKLDYTFFKVTDDNGDIVDQTLDGLYWFIPNLRTPAAYWKDETGVASVDVQVLEVPGYEAAIAKGDNEKYIISTAQGEPVLNDANPPVQIGYSGKITFTPTEIGSTLKKSIIQVSGQAQGGKLLYREIMITLMDKPSFIYVSPVGTPFLTEVRYDAVYGLDQNVDLRICLPAGLGSSLFPIQIRIEAENNTLSATNPKLPVTTGKSDFDDSRNTFFYIYTINYSDYCSLNPSTKKYEYKYIYGGTEQDRIRFKTNKQGDNSTRIRLRDLAGNFNPVDLTIGTVPAPPTPDPDPEP